MRLREYAELLGVTYQTAWNRYKAGKIPQAFKVEGTVYVPDNILEILQEKNNE